MAWSASKIFAAAIAALANRDAVALDMNADAFKVALFDNSITPDATVAAASTAYGAGVWAGGGVADASGWPAAGRSLASVASTFSGATYTFTAANTASANSTTTLVDNYGCLVYDDTATSPADSGWTFNYFGGAQQITSGLYTLQWNASGIATIGV